MAELTFDGTRATPPYEVHTFADLDALLVKRLADIDPDCYDDETIAHIGPRKHNLQLGLNIAYREVRLAIASAVERESA
ncbi:MAG: hypothetical protein LC798_11170 [Chloroflexi bacterium]|nr:hypothetical protein [Chloroflexota bacterium]